MAMSRPYRPDDRDACLALFDSNAPRFFDFSEREGFEDFLESLASASAYQVIVRDGQIVGCGGHMVEPDGVSAALCWGMVDGAVHGEGLGSALTETRLAAVRKIPGITHIVLGTSQHTQSFYARYGFKMTAVTPDGYGPGIDRWDMVLQLE